MDERDDWGSESQAKVNCEGSMGEEEGLPSSSERRTRCVRRRGTTRSEGKVQGDDQPFRFTRPMERV
ncbi:hypothetical protein FA13DRAFT_1723780 [Coprinellus micaceus]|uniref:Uncharacterized protein n=1 Tax=Coprinellus micaceus TaxID=71717 RepID=A0A4Y7U151_COPMI|nr:hypothetical protein FA13DRAFT_1723780 [Coprinellus micaceus]